MGGEGVTAGGGGGATALWLDGGTESAPESGEGVIETGRGGGGQIRLPSVHGKM